MSVIGKAVKFSPYITQKIGGGISVCKINIEEIEKYVRIGFFQDLEFVEKFHFADSSLRGLVLSNVKNINELNEYHPLTCYAIYYNGVAIGFTVVGKKLLYSFGINKYYRSKEIVLRWFSWVKDILNNDFVVCLFPENTRAANFFKRNGMKISNEDKTNVTLILE